MSQLEAFRERMVAVGLARRTINQYYDAAKLFERNDLSVEQFLLACPNKYIYRYGLRAYLSFLGREKEYYDFAKKHKLKKKHPRQRHPFTPSEVKRVIEALPTEAMRVLGSIELDTGERVGALIGLKRTDVETNQGDTYIIVRTKGGEDRTHYLSPHVRDLLVKYIASLPDWQKDLFMFARSSHASYCLYAKALTKTSQEVLNRKLRTHDIRRARAVHLLRSGFDIVSVKDALGHKSVKTTEIYLSGAGVSSKEIAKKLDLWKDFDNAE